MNIKLIKEKWIKFYKRGFLTGLMVLCFLCLIDQTLQTPFFFNKIDSGNFMLTLFIWISFLWINKFYFYFTQFFYFPEVQK